LKYISENRAGLIQLVGDRDEWGDEIIGKAMGILKLLGSDKAFSY
jgi:hypothetical protein